MLCSFVFALFLLHIAYGTGVFCTQKNGCVLQDGRAVTCSGIVLGSGMHILRAREAPDGKFYASSDLTLVDQTEVQPSKPEAVAVDINPNVAHRKVLDGSARNIDDSRAVIIGTASLDNRPYTLKSRYLPAPVVCVIAAFGSPFGLCCCACPLFSNGCWASNCHNTCGGSF